MKSKWGEDDDVIGPLSKLKDNTEIIDRFFVKPDGSNKFKKN
jgi:hypothetical protein